MAPAKAKEKRKKRGGLIDALWGPLGLLLIFVVMAICAAAFAMMYDSIIELQEHQ